MVLNGFILSCINLLTWIVSFRSFETFCFIKFSVQKEKMGYGVMKMIKLEALIPILCQSMYIFSFYQDKGYEFFSFKLNPA